MRTRVYGLAIGLFLPLTALAAYTSQQLAKDIETIAGLVAADEKRYVTNYLRTGPSGLGQGDFLTAAMARNALNKITSDQSAAPALARTMQRHAQGTNFPADTRQYGFAKLTQLAGRDGEVEGMARSLAEEFVKTEEGPLNRAAERFLREARQSSAVSNVTPSQFVGRWRHLDEVRKLATNLTFREDGTYSGNVEVSGKANGSFSGKWTLNDGTLNYEYTASSDKHIPAGTKDQDKVIEIDKDHYTIENTLGLRETYFRVK